MYKYWKKAYQLGCWTPTDSHIYVKWEEKYGLSITFASNGFFKWLNLTKHWKQYRDQLLYSICIFLPIYIVTHKTRMKMFALEYDLLYSVILFLLLIINQSRITQWDGTVCWYFYFILTVPLWTMLMDPPWN